MDFITYLEQRLHEPLPGLRAHRQFVPAIPDAAKRLTAPPDDARQSAVLVPLIEMAGVLPSIMLTLRSEQLRNHKGQISFPGGRVDAGEAIVDAALRELDEEVGIAPDDVVVLGTLSPLYIPPSNSAVTPVVGRVHLPEHYRLSEAEVQEVFLLPLSDLVDPASIAEELWTLYGQSVNVPHWKVHPAAPLWGATAMILNELIFIAREYLDIITDERQ